jgi:ABC-type polysaccharide/polyol phosphate transport system ATPase subunit
VIDLAGKGETLLTFEHVSKHYPPPPPMRVRRFFARFQGLHVQEGFAADALSGGDLDDDEMVDDDDLEGEPEPLPVADGRRVLDDVSLRLPAGSLVALLGPEHGGKTMLLKVAAGIVAPSEGRVVTRGLVAPALGFVSLAFPSKGHRVKGTLPQLAAMIGIPPARVRGRFDAIAELMDRPALLKASTSLMDSQTKRELVLAMALAIEPDVLLLDIPIPPTKFGDRCIERISALREGGSLVVAEMRNVFKTPEALTVDHAIALEHGRLTDPSRWTRSKKAKHQHRHVV